MVLVCDEMSSKEVRTFEVVRFPSEMQNPHQIGPEVSVHGNWDIPPVCHRTGDG